jgi:uncharacterized protein
LPFGQKEYYYLVTKDSRMQHWEIVFLFLIIAFVYASVGFGGGSSYLAVLTFYALPFQEIKLTALICNIIVVTGGVIIFIRNGQLNWRRVLPLVVVSVPMAFVGARLKLKEDTFFVILGLSLIAAAVLLWIQNRRGKVTGAGDGKGSMMADMLLGGGIGFLSGMVGIGGGIFLSPILNLTGWDTSKKIAAAASVFILVNSVSGIAGQLSALPAGISYARIGMLCGAVLVGGQAGSRMGAVKFNLLVVRRITAALVFVAGLEVLLKHLPLNL